MFLSWLLIWSNINTKLFLVEHLKICLFGNDQQDRIIITLLRGGFNSRKWKMILAFSKISETYHGIKIDAGNDFKFQLARVKLCHFNFF